MTGCQSSQDIQIDSTGTAWKSEVKKEGRFNMQQVKLEFTV